MIAPVILKKKLHHVVPNWIGHGDYFHIRIRSDQKYNLALTDKRIAKKLLESAVFYDLEDRWHLGLFLLMPDHIHALISFPFHESMSQVVRSWKAYHKRETGIMWQVGYFDHRIRNATELDVKADYIRNNPVVEGLCRDSDDWRWKLDQNNINDEKRRLNGKP